MKRPEKSHCAEGWVEGCIHSGHFFFVVGELSKTSFRVRTDIGLWGSTRSV